MVRRGVWLTPRFTIRSSGGKMKIILSSAPLPLYPLYPLYSPMTAEVLKKISEKTCVKLLKF
jgi:hypothetical protein